jgi:hypothetical protein
VDLEVRDMGAARHRRRALGVLVLVLAFAGCGMGGEDEAEKYDTIANEIQVGTDADGLATGDEASSEGSGEGEGGEAEPVSALGGSPLVSSGRQFISTAQLGIGAESVAATAERAIALVEAKGGALFGESSTYEGEPQAVLTLKVAPDQFSTTLRELGELGTVQHQSVDTQDVTERVVDLESRITTASESVARLQGFLGGAGSVADVAAFEAELVARETELETLRAQLRTLEDQIDLSTIVLTITQLDEEGEVAAVDDEEDALPGFLDALEGSWDALLTAGTLALVVLGAALPWLPLLALVWLAVRLGRRRASRPLPPPAATASS